MKHVLLTLAGLMLCAAGLQAEEDKKPKQKPKAKAKPKRKAIRLRAFPAAGGGAIRIGTGFYGGANKLNLLRRPDVVKELKLDGDQQKEVAEAIQEIQKNRRDELQKVRKLAPAERLKKMRAATKKYNDMGTEKAKEILKEEQFARLEQIALQMQGLRALRNPDVAKKLKITKEQTQKFQDVQTEITKERQKLYKDLRNGNLDRTKLREKTQALTKSLEKKTLEVLDKDQQAKFEKMKGNKFELQRRAFAPGVRLRKINGKKIQIKRIKVKGKAVRPKKVDDK